MSAGDVSKAIFREWIDDDAQHADLFRAFLAGFNVGHECAEANRARDMSEREFAEWQVQMFESRVEGSIKGEE